MPEKQTELENQLRLMTLSQYVKTSYFESKKNKHELSNGLVPTVDYKMSTHKIELGKEVYEIILQIEVTSKLEEEELFRVLLSYAGMFQLEGNVAAEVKDEVLLTQCAILLFPFARREIAALTLSGGFQPMLLDTVDFRAAYMQHRKQEDEKKLQELMNGVG